MVYYFFIIRSDVCWCTLFMALNLALCSSANYTQCFGHILVYLWAFVLQKLAVLQDLYSPITISGTILMTLYSMLWDRGYKSSANALFILREDACSLIVQYSTHFPFVLSGVYYEWMNKIYFVNGVGGMVFGLIGCQSLSPSLTLLTVFNYNNNTSQVIYMWWWLILFSFLMLLFKICSK